MNASKIYLFLFLNERRFGVEWCNIFVGMDMARNDSNGLLFYCFRVHCCSAFLYMYDVRAYQRMVVTLFPTRARMIYRQINTFQLL